MHSTIKLDKWSNSNENNSQNNKNIMRNRYLLVTPTLDMYYN